QTCCETGTVLFGNTNVHVLVGQSLRECRGLAGLRNVAVNNVNLRACLTDFLGDVSPLKRMRLN
ncbi:hypothetical protein, partial [Schaalia turicensis]|uniref:hypothetical protein n=1 Tax=Schaalia turicensis TaxID=131111 RepID=UPI0034A50806